MQLASVGRHPNTISHVAYWNFGLKLLAERMITEIHIDKIIKI